MSCQVHNDEYSNTYSSNTNRSDTEECSNNDRSDTAEECSTFHDSSDNNSTKCSTLTDARQTQTAPAPFAPTPTASPLLHNQQRPPLQQEQRRPLLQNYSKTDIALCSNTNGALCFNTNSALRSNTNIDLRSISNSISNS
jgi:hypothetical protein